MHVQIINFSSNVSEEELFEWYDGAASAFGELPGLTAKIWLANREENTYGAVYLWRDRDSMEEFVNGDLFAAVKNSPNIANPTSRDFDVLEKYTAQTQPGLRVLEAAAA